MNSRIAIGTVQFGLDYGINNKTGEITEEAVFAILDKAAESGITCIDTARNYGTSELKLGKYNAARDSKFNFISKSKFTDPAELENAFNDSLKKLNISKLYAY